MFPFSLFFFFKDSCPRNHAACCVQIVIFRPGSISGCATTAFLPQKKKKEKNKKQGRLKQSRKQGAPCAPSLHPSPIASSPQIGSPSCIRVQLPEQPRSPGKLRQILIQNKLQRRQQQTRSPKETINKDLKKRANLKNENLTAKVRTHFSGPVPQFSRPTGRCNRNGSRTSFLPHLHTALVRHRLAYSILALHGLSNSLETRLLARSLRVCLGVPRAASAV